MAIPNGDVKVETAESFAKDYLDDLFNNNKNLGAFEEETLDLNIKSKYDDIVIEEEDQNPTESVPASENTESFIAESEVPVVASENSEEPLEPGQQILQVNGHANEVEVVVEVEVSAQNGDLEPQVEAEVPEPGQVQFTDQSSEPALTEQVSTLSIQADEPLEPGNTTLQAAEVVVEEVQVEKESAEEAAPVPMSRNKPAAISENEDEEDALTDMQFKRIGLSQSWWNSKRTETENTQERSQPVDKFKTIKQNIRRGNTRSLLERFENMSKVAE